MVLRAAPGFSEYVTLQRVPSPAPVQTLFFMTLTYMKRKWCRRHTGTLWGRRRWVKPVLVPKIFGDGKVVIALRPIATRLHHYVVAIDSTWNLDNHCNFDLKPGQAPQPELHDHLDEIYDAIIDHFGEVDTDEDGERTGDSFKQWPAIDLSIGCEWTQLNTNFWRRIRARLRVLEKAA